MIQALSPDAANYSLHIRILPWRARGRKHFFNAEAFHSKSESITIDAIPVTQQVAWSGVEWEGLHKLLCCPLGSRMSGHVRVNDFSPVETQNDKCV